MLSPFFPSSPPTKSWNLRKIKSTNQTKEGGAIIVTFVSSSTSFLYKLLCNYIQHYFGWIGMCHDLSNKLRYTFSQVFMSQKTFQIIFFEKKRSECPLVADTEKRPSILGKVSIHKIVEMKTRPLSCLFSISQQHLYISSQRCEILYSDNLCSDWSLF